MQEADAHVHDSNASHGCLEPPEYRYGDALLFLSFLRLCGIAELAFDRHIVPSSPQSIRADPDARWSSFARSCDVAIGCEATRSGVTSVTRVLKQC